MAGPHFVKILINRESQFLKKKWISRWKLVFFFIFDLPRSKWQIRFFAPEPTTRATCAPRGSDGTCVFGECTLRSGTPL